MSYNTNFVGKELVIFNRLDTVRQVKFHIKLNIIRRFLVVIKASAQYTIFAIALY